MSTTRSPGARLLAGGLLATLLAACGDRSGTTGSSAPRTSKAGVSPTASSFAWTQSVDVDYDYAQTLTGSLAVVGIQKPAVALVIATVGAGTSAYANRHGVRPTPPLPASYGDIILTRYVVQVERVLAGTAPAGGEVYARGGVIGPDRTSGPRMPGLLTGHRALLILGDAATDPTGRGLPPVLAALPMRGSEIFASQSLGEGTDDLARVRTPDTYTLGKAPGRKSMDPPLEGYWVPLADAIATANALRAKRSAPPLAAP